MFTSPLDNIYNFFEFITHELKYNPITIGVWGYSIYVTGLLIYLFIKKRNRKTERRSLFSRIDRLFNITNNDLDSITKQELQENNYLIETFTLAHYAMQLKLIFKCPLLLEKNEFKALPSNIRKLYDLGKNETILTQVGIVGLLSLQSKVKCMEELTNSQTKIKLPAYIYDIPKTKKELLSLLYMLHKVCNEFQIMDNVYGKYEPNDFLYDILDEVLKK